MLVLGIETSCDETAAALVTDKREIRANVVLSQLAEHAPYGGIVPEIAARSHIDHLDGLIARAMADAGATFADLDGVAVTAGPGLIGAVMVGLMTGKAVAAVHDLPLSAVNHLEGHALSARLSDAELQFPYLLLLVSGGHCQLLVVEGVGRYQRLGTTIDDAAGEAFDKAAKLLGLGYPGGPAIERAAKNGDGTRFDLPRPLKGRVGCDFSFSGLKTALLHKVQALEGGLDDSLRADLAASFQQAVADVVADRCQNAIRSFRADHPEGRFLVAGGGVVANSMLRARLKELAIANDLSLALPPLALCTDNAAMIAWAGIERLSLGLADDLNAVPRARWPLDGNAVPPPGVGRAGKLGPKA
jgi:N6-L-threonylcarbamoyladenine synthase